MDKVPVLLAGLDWSTESNDANVVVENVDTAIAIHAGCYHRFDIGRLGDVALDDVTLTPLVFELKISEGGGSVSWYCPDTILQKQL